MLSNETAVGGDFLVHISSRFDDNVLSQAVTLQVMVVFVFRILFLLLTHPVNHFTKPTVYAYAG